MPTQRRWIALSALCSLLAAPLAGQNPSAFVVSGPEEGRRAPGFTLDAAGKDGPSDRPFDLSLQLGRVVVLAFYQRDFTPTATLELQTFADRYHDLFGDSTTVVAIGVDSVASHVSFAQSLALPFALLSDTGLRVARMYGSVRGDGYARYSVYVLGFDGRVRWRDMQFDPHRDGAYDDLKRAVALAGQ
jgi:peroxiredoxin